MNKNLFLLLLLTCSLAAGAAQSWAYSAPRETAAVQSDEQDSSDDSDDSDSGDEDSDDSFDENADGPDEGPIIGDEDNRPKER